MCLYLNLLIQLMKLRIFNVILEKKNGDKITQTQQLKQFIYVLHSLGQVKCYFFETYYLTFTGKFSFFFKKNLLQLNVISLTFGKNF